MIPSAMDCATRRNTTAKTPKKKAITKIIGTARLTVDLKDANRLFDVPHILVGLLNRAPENSHAAVHRFVLTKGRLQSVSQAHRSNPKLRPKSLTRSTVLLASR